MPTIVCVCVCVCVQAVHTLSEATQIKQTTGDAMETIFRKDGKVTWNIGHLVQLQGKNQQHQSEPTQPSYCWLQSILRTVGTVVKTRGLAKPTPWPILHPQCVELGHLEWNWLLSRTQRTPSLNLQRIKRRPCYKYLIPKHLCKIYSAFILLINIAFHPRLHHRIRHTKQLS